MATQRALMFGQPLAREFSERDISPVFKANGTRNPNTPAYNALAAANFANWRLRIDGLVERPVDLGIADLRALPSRTQITRHDCVEGWSAIGKWQGAQLGPLLQSVGLKPNARFAVMHCADNYGGGADMYYESIDLVDGFHPQTILAYDLNGQPLDIAHGAPLRLRVERQLGYKHAKYLMRIEMVERLDTFGRGRGGYWEDRGYEWYAGI
jgi:DMSO/TMAO reductase YedYZ molybdopterin-dependent catalytic subunit